MITQIINGYKVTVSIEKVTPLIACQWLESKNKKNRHRNQNHVNALVKNMKEGSWRFNGDTICFDANDVLIDGQHRLAAIIESNIEQDCIIVRGLDPETIKTKDMEIKPRNLSDLLRMDNIAQANKKAAIVTRYILMSAGKTILNSISKGSSTSGNNKNISTMDAKYKTYYQFQNIFDECCLYASCLNDRVNFFTVGEIGGIYAYLYIDLHHSEDEIKGFFDRLFINQTDKNVINILRDKLIRDLGATNKMTAATKQSLLAKTWNYYIKQKDVKVLSYNRLTEGQIEFI